MYGAEQNDEIKKLLDEDYISPQIRQIFRHNQTDQLLSKHIWKEELRRIREKPTTQKHNVLDMLTRLNPDLGRQFADLSGYTRPVKMPAGIMEQQRLRLSQKSGRSSQTERPLSQMAEGGGRSIDYYEKQQQLKSKTKKKK
jgi:hypothetical protein